MSGETELREAIKLICNQGYWVNSRGKGNEARDIRQWKELIDVANLDRDILGNWELEENIL